VHPVFVAPQSLAGNRRGGLRILKAAELKRFAASLGRDNVKNDIIAKCLMFP
jgi:hypothetical protein